LADTVLQRIFKGSGTALLVRGVIAILFGILVMAVPGVTVLTLVIFFGVYALSDGTRTSPTISPAPGADPAGSWPAASFPYSRASPRCSGQALPPCRWHS
jgi:hypothetical protein